MIENIGIAMLATFMLWAIPFNHWYAESVSKDLTIKGAILFGWIITGEVLMIIGELT